MKYDELETDRLKLRMWRESDLDDYAELTADPDVMRFLPPGKPFTRGDAWRSIAFFMGHWQMKVAERLGERREGTARIGEWDVLVYGIDRS